MNWDNFKPEDHARALETELEKEHSKTVPIMPQAEWTVEELDASDEILEGLMNTYMDENRSDFERDRAHRKAQAIIEARVGNTQVVGSMQMEGTSAGKPINKTMRDTGHGEGYASRAAVTRKPNAGDPRYTVVPGEIDNRYKRFSNEGE
jgi:hypothetical protein